MVAVVARQARGPASRPCRPTPWRPRPRERYERRWPECTPLYRVVTRHLETWLATRSRAERPVPTHVETELRELMRCGSLCHGSARARCAGCGHSFLVAFPCKGRGVCPSCTGRRMAQTAAHLADRVIPPVPVRQWVVSAPKRLRGFLADRPDAVTLLTRIVLDEIRRLLVGGAAASGPQGSRQRRTTALGAVSFLHRFGSARSRHVHLHACVTDGVFTGAPDSVSFLADPTYHGSRSRGHYRACPQEGRRLVPPPRLARR